MGSLNDFAQVREQPEEISEKKRMKSYVVFLLQLAFTMLFVVAAFFIVYGDATFGGAVSVYLQQGLEMENSWFFPEDVQPVDNDEDESLYRLPCSGEVKKAMVRNSEGGLDVAGFAIAGAEDEDIFPMTAGMVSKLADNEGVFTVQIDHENSIYTVYSGLKELSVAVGDAVDSQSIGTLGGNGLLFAVYINGAPVDPAALFGQIVN
ncbi:MAG: M23 family metallopeptidase [Firmicutes bacterium]|nr:M23 family metallopeptidase [Bacillota bacterium]